MFSVLTAFALQQLKWWPPPPAWDIYWPTLALVIVTGIALVVAVGTLRAIRRQVSEMQETGKQTEKLIGENIAQSASLAQSVKETARFASAMEVVAGSLKETAKVSNETLKGVRQQMRAYISVGVGGAVYQERGKNLRFEAKPVLTNNGLTPAHKVRHRSKAQIMSIPIALDFDYPLPAADSGENLIGPRQTAVLNAVVDDYVPDAAVDEIKNGNGKALVVWGVIKYEDVFGDQQQTRFCQILTWLQDGTVWGYFAPGHNDGT